MLHFFSTRSFALCLAMLLALPAAACPYCVIESSTLTEEIDSSDIAVIARLVKEEASAEPAPLQEETNGEEPNGEEASELASEFGVVDPGTGLAKFHVERVLLGKKLLKGAEVIETVFFEEVDYEKRYFIRGKQDQLADRTDWNIPIPLSGTAVQYIDHLKKLPAEGPGRILFFLDYLQHEDRLLAQDAYDEFARAPYSDIRAIADKLDRQQVWQWIEDPDVSPNRRSLFFTLLGVCGTEQDRQRLRQILLVDDRVLRSVAEASASLAIGLGGAITLPAISEMVSMDLRRKQLGFNAMVGCYLKLAGLEGLDELDVLFLANPQAHPSKVYGTLLALRFLAEEDDSMPLERIIESMRLVLSKSDFAEQAITDLARWQDWSVLDQLIEMFRTAKPYTYVKEPIIAYLDQASQQPGEIGEKAAAAIVEFEKLDPEAVRRSRSLMAFGYLGRARPASPKSSTAVANAVTNDANASEPEPAKADEKMTDHAVKKNDDALVSEPINRWQLLGLPLLAAGVLAVLVWSLLRSSV